MTIDKPNADQIAGLRQLWKEAFGDEEAFLDDFFGTGFSPDRCRCITIENDIRNSPSPISTAWPPPKRIVARVCATPSWPIPIES